MCIFVRTQTHPLEVDKIVPSKPRSPMPRKVVSDSLIDHNRVMRMILEIAHEQSLTSLLQKVVAGAPDRPGFACSQVWLVDKGDLCSSCPSRRQCPDQDRCLHLMAARINPLAGASPAASSSEYLKIRIPLGAGLFGKVAVDGKENLQPYARTDWNEDVGLNMEKERVRWVGGTPILFKGEVLGVLASYLRKGISDEARPWGRIVADRIGASIANARAFEEIQRLKTQLELQNSYLQEEVIEAKAFGALIGQSAALRQIVSQIDLVAPTEASVLILGETGTGKELVAREIHHRSHRKDRPLIRVNCASIPGELFESEFFGHVRGAFTGAVKDRAGRFETADGGTLFLDEIGEVPLEMQGKLLRVLQEKRYERVGEDRTRNADVRIVGATNRDLKKAVAAGRFREDLYYRLHVFPIQVAPLRERRDDIPLLAKHFIELSVKELKYLTPRLTRAGVSQLQSYDWPGNIRELRNVIERAVILAQGGNLNFDLPINVVQSTASRMPTGDSASPERKYRTEEELRQSERENLLLVLEEAKWKIKGPGGAAELLGVNETTLFSRLRRMGVQQPRH